jgi:hypothetical protein
MSNWDDSVTRILASGGGPTLKSGRKRFWKPRQPPIPVLGAAGAGKTELWRLLTGGSAKDQLSLTVDKKDYFGTTKRSARALITIPAQIGQDRLEAEKIFFKSETASVKGVIFVACYGYNFIWPQQVGTVDNEAEFSEFSVASLSTRNSNKELERFADTCKLIQEKWELAPREICPQWLLVICNKVDLYWDEINTAKGYYDDGCGGSFDDLAQTLVGNLSGQGFSYHVLPAAMRSRDYIYKSDRGTLKVAPTLTQAQCDASLNVIVDKLGELCGR